MKQLKDGYLYKGSNSQLIEYTNAYYPSDLHKERSQKNYLFTYIGTIVSWRFVKQILMATSSNHYEIIVTLEFYSNCLQLDFS